MRVLQLVLGEQIWGIETYIFRLCGGLIAQGDSVFAACATDGAIKQELQRIGVETAVVPMASYIDMGSVNELKALVARWKPDVIHAHMGRDSFLGALVAAQTNVAIVCSVHFVEPAYMRYPFLIRQLWRILQMGKNRMVSRFLPVSDVVADRLMKRESVSRDKITVVCPGVPNIDRVTASERNQARSALGLADAQLVIATIARLTKEKGVDTLVETAPDVVRELPAAVFLIAGDGPERQPLQQLAASNNSSQSVRFLGYLSNARNLIAAADVVVAPSREEAFGYAALEALCAGVPVIGTDAPGLSEVLGCASATVVGRDDPAQLAAAIIQGLSNRSQVDETVRNSLTEMFSVANMVSQVRRVYTAVQVANGVH